MTISSRPWHDHPTPPILVAIGTRNRPEDLDRCLASLAGVVYPSWSILIIDQSTDDRARLVAERRRADLPTTITYRWMRTRGLSRARNLALDLAGDRIIAFTDDDCTVQPDWLQQIAGVYRRYPAASMCYGSTFAAPELLHVADNVPMHIVRREHVYEPGVGRTEQCGMGASMSVWPARQHRPLRFDNQMGAGSAFRSCEDTDYGMRAVSAGETVMETPAVFVFHFGVRPNEGNISRCYWQSVWYAMGTTHIKRLRRGERGGLVLVFHWLRAWGPWPLRREGKRWRGSFEADMFRVYLLGIFSSFRMRVDRETGVYVARSGGVR